jgi:hypothetical protein
MALLEGILITVAALEGATITFILIDGQRKRKALAKWQEGTVKPALAQVAGHDERIGDLTRAVDLLVPPDARPTTAHRAALPPAPVGETLAAVEMGAQARHLGPRSAWRCTDRASRLT